MFRTFVGFQELCKKFLNDTSFIEIFSVVCSTFFYTASWETILIRNVINWILKWVYKVSISLA